MLTVLLNAVDTFLDDVQARDPDSVPGAGWGYLDENRDPRQWRMELTALGGEIGQVRYGDIEAHRVLLGRLHTLLPHGKPYPPGAEAYVISPQMHNVVRAAAATLTPQDLLTLDPDTDLPTPAGLVLLPAACGSPTSVYAPVSVIGWRPETNRILPDGPSRAGVWVEGFSQRRDIDQRPIWPLVVRASRAASARPPLTLPLSHEWLVPAAAITEPEQAALARLSSLNRAVREQKISDYGEYDPQRDTEFSLAAYAFAFWRLCRQPLTTTSWHTLTHHPGHDEPAAGTAGRRRPEGLDRVRIVHLRPPPARDPDDTDDVDGSVGAQRRYHHRWPVRMHKVRQFYPSTGTHKIIWRGPYIKGPDGAPC
ncbi:hypothetical protein KDL28_29370 [Pseudonocardia sp. S2-4]|uniref:Uncharacterized protein n=1 Tax=Pseudonocardia humida TaxID=2800819 RepID=A0ABT1A8N8_9PSEU|nr:hypothetical protein [Pseudonocardia humida]